MNQNLNRILSEQKGKTKLSLLICLSMLAASVLLLVSGQMIGLVFLAMSLIIGAALLVRIRRARAEMSKLGNNDEAGKKLDGAGAVYYPAFGLTIGPDFAVLEKPVLQVFLLHEMSKFEVGLAGDVQKVLFLTDRDGKRHPIAETRKEDDHQADFDRAYQQIRAIFAEKNAGN